MSTDLKENVDTRSEASQLLKENVDARSEASQLLKENVDTRSEANPCQVTRIDADVENSTLSVRYNTTVVDRAACGDGKPLCNPESKNEKSYAVLQTAKTKWDLADIDVIQHQGKVTCCRKERAIIKCGNVFSNEVDLPGIPQDDIIYPLLFNDTHLVIRLKPKQHVKDYNVQVYQRVPQKLLATKNKVVSATDIVIPGNYTDQKKVLVKFSKNLRMKCKDGHDPFHIDITKTVETTDTPYSQTTAPPNLLYVSVGAVAGSVLVIAVVLWFYRGRTDVVIDQTVSCIPEDLNIQSVLVVHTKESRKLCQEVKMMMGEFKDTRIRKIYDIYSIKEEEAIANAQPWVLSHFSGPKASSSAVIVVCSPGLPKLAQSLREGKNDADAIGVLGRGFLPSDCLLLTFVRQLVESPLAWNSSRFFPVWFENIQDTTHVEEWQEEMAHASLPNIGRSVLFCLPSHIVLLKRSLDSSYIS
ncbi:uncharacterized protein [Palaemon carinicauda]|uniref:uncharacterized protein n=1 Tax=Palaemon carinicauda TaxID=392227 RepID=UPI0035B6A8DF